MSTPNKRFLFEVSWEVCNKVGGIYTVLQSKAPSAVAEYGDDYYLLGPYLKTNREFEETDEACWERLRENTALKDIPCRFGRWTIPGRPKAVLVDFARKYNRDQLLYKLWEQYGVDSISGGWDYVEPVMFSYACSEIIATIFNLLARPAGATAVAQFHEWMCGAGLLGLKKQVPEIGTVFTTHATVLGRALSGTGVDLYATMERIAPQREAVAHNVAAKHSMECAAAREADCFTTVSAITATEAQSFLGRRPDVILPNGLDMDSVPDLAENRQLAAAPRRKLLEFAARVLGRPVPPAARLMLISGRYEFRNKGIDLFIEALGRLQADMPPDHFTVAFLFVMGEHREINQALLQDGAAPGTSHPPLLVTHRLQNEGADPILQQCSRFGLHNAPDSRVAVIYMPAFLDGYDGLLNMNYYDVLSACDLGVFPSIYEPWGYTPLESAAYAVPTVTTDQAGFGLWVRDTLGSNNGVIILNRQKQAPAAIVTQLAAILRECQQWSDAEFAHRRRAARQIALHAGWKNFFRHYRDAYAAAAAAAAARAQHAAAGLDDGAARATFAGTASLQPHFRHFTAVVNLPPGLKLLREIAYNLWWSWNPEALELFARLDAQLWPHMDNNPVRMLESVSATRLQDAERDKDYQALYARVAERFAESRREPDDGNRLLKSTLIKRAAPVAYFSMEYGLHECLPIYAGGLGVLSGDHLKTASDLAVPLVGIGLLYRQGYSRQRIDAAGGQVVDYPRSDFTLLPVRPVQDDRGTLAQVALELPGRTLYADIWEARVGRVTLYLLDTDIPRNTAQDRTITGQLYCADRRQRLEQELLLGVGGVRLLRRLGIVPAVYHMNEGHSAFLTLERIGNLMVEEGLSFDEAREAVRGNTVFTTHTPVEAGNEQFEKAMIEYYFGGIVQRLGITWPQFWELGRRDEGDGKPFYMTILGLKLSSRRNAVSRLHGAVSRRMWRDVWKGFNEADIPIGYITNGVHMPSVVGAPMRQLLAAHVGPDWDRTGSDAARWKRVERIPDNDLWQAKCLQKRALLDRLATPADWQCAPDGKSGRKRPATPERAQPGALLIGFARRFAPYKRADLILSDLERLDRLVNSAERPVRIVFAGKAHPNDHAGAALVKKVVAVCNDERFRGKILFLENYNLGLARALLQGVDVWLNTPIRSFEASGTSGQKAAINGTLNLSVSDGWWCEGYDGSNGWTIGPVVGDRPATDAPAESDAASLYALLEHTVVPLFYEREAGGLPVKWLAMLKRSLASLVPRFNADRMFREYFTESYQPAAERGAALAADHYKLARRLAEWKRKVPVRFSSLRIVDVTLDGIAGEALPIGAPFTVRVRIDPGSIEPGELLVEMVLGKPEDDDFAQTPQCLPLQFVKKQDQLLLFTAAGIVHENGRYAYGIRVMPTNADLASKQDAELVLWG